MRIVRFPDNPIIRPNMDERMGANINGPSLIRVPNWAPQPLGRYYLYFAAHNGDYIRLAYADRLAGPWRIHTPGTLQLGESFCAGHLASPDVHLDHARRQIRMYYHGPDTERDGQWTRVATSPDGLHFTARSEILGLSYFRVFRWRGWHYALGMPGVLYRSRDGLSGFQEGPTLFGPDMRHSAVLVHGTVVHSDVAQPPRLTAGGQAPAVNGRPHGAAPTARPRSEHTRDTPANTLLVFYTNAGGCPERILLSRIPLAGSWRTWRASEPETVLAPETDYEGANLPLKPSVRGAITTPAHQLRDPAIYRERGRTYLLYAVAGESGIAIAEVKY